MPRNASGIYTLPGGNPVTPGDVIEASWANTTLEDVADALTNSLSRTGAGGMLAPFRIADGSISAPGLSYLNETNTGLYRSGSGSTWMAVLGVNVAQFSTVGVTIPFGKALTALGNASVSGSLAVTGATTLGSSLAVAGAVTATGGVVGNVTGNVTAASGSSSFNNVTISGSLDMVAGSSATITGLNNPVNASDAANKGYVDAQDALKLSLTGGTMSGNIAMGGNLVTGMGAPSAGGDATNKTYVDAQVATRLALSGGTMSGAINMNGYGIVGLPTPSDPSEAANKSYVDNIAQGIDAKASCKVASIGNMTLSNTQIYDGVALVAGDRVLAKDQTDTSRNGIYVVASGVWPRAADANTWDELVAAYTFIEQGTNANNGYICTVSAGGTLNVTPVTWAQFSGAGQIDAGPGLVKTGNQLSVGTASSSRIVVNTDDIDLATTGVTASTYKSVTVDAYGRVTAGTNPTTLAGFGITDAYTQTQVDTLVNAKLSLSGGTMSGAIAMGGFKVTGLGAPTNAGDAATKTYVDTADALKLNLTGGTMSGVIAMGANKITGLADPTLAQDAATKNYIDTIFGSTTSAAASATAAASSASAAATSATNAATSATNAATSATNASTTYTNFNNQYLGSKTSDPTVNNTGGALMAGNLYWNSTVSEMRVYNGSAWVAAYLPAAGYLALTGGTMTGSIVFAAAQSFTGTNFIPTSSTVTGNSMYLPAANTLGWSINGSEAMRVNSTGFVVGSSTPKLRFQVSAASAQNAPTLGTAQGIAYLSNNDPAYGLCIGNSSATGVAWFQSQRTDGTATAYGLALSPAGGNVLVGTATDNATDKLQVNGTIKSLTGGFVFPDGTTQTTAATGGGSAATPTALGTVYGKYDTTYNQTFVGYSAGSASSTAAHNVAVGSSAMSAITTGTRNIVVGSYAAGALTTGEGNVVLGTFGVGSGTNTFSNNTSGSNNIAVGGESLTSNTTASNNIGIGYRTLTANTTGTPNLAIGVSALQANTTGGSNVALGDNTLRSNTTASNNTAVGYQALYANTGSDSTAVGYKALFSNTTGTNVAVGESCLQSNTTGTTNVAIAPYSALYSNTTGSQNNAVGHQALQNNTTASNNNAFGYRALYSNTTGSKNTAFGDSALYSNTTANGLTAVGYGALALANRTSDANGDSTAIGYQSGYGQTTGNNNVFIGYNAGNYSVITTTGYQNILIGNYTSNSAASANNELVIGTVVTGKGSNTGFISPGTGGIYQGNNSSSWSTTSDQRLKKNIVDNNIGLSAITSIRVRNFEYRLEDEITELSKDCAIKKEGVQLGVIAQELQAVLPECVKQESTGVLSVDTDNLTWYLINAVKELSARVKQLEGN